MRDVLTLLTKSTREDNLFALNTILIKLIITEFIHNKAAMTRMPFLIIAAYFSIIFKFALANPIFIWIIKCEELFLLL